MSSNKNNKIMQRRYIDSSSFKMALLFTILLSCILFSWAYIIYSYTGIRTNKYLLAIFIGFFCMLIVVVISYLISIYVVNKINHIIISAASIIESQDFSRRIKSNSNWDDLSNLSNIFNILFKSVDDLLYDIKNVTDNIAHDLKTPLTRLKNRLENLVEVQPNDDNTKSLDECNKLLDVFNSLLKLNRLEHGREKITKSKLSIKNLMNDAIELYEPVFYQKNVKLTINIEEKTLSIDKNLIFQSIVNILDNYYKYSNVNSEVVIDGYINESDYMIIISDNSNGVAAENIAKIFDRFYREQKSRTNSGNGLGLSLVKKIIQLHGGNIIAKNNDPKGLITIISLPLH